MTWLGLPSVLVVWPELRLDVAPLVEADVRQMEANRLGRATYSANHPGVVRVRSGLLSLVVGRCTIWVWPSWPRSHVRRPCRWRCSRGRRWRSREQQRGSHFSSCGFGGGRPAGPGFAAGAPPESLSRATPIRTQSPSTRQIRVRAVKWTLRRGPLAVFNPDLHLPAERTPADFASSRPTPIADAEASHAVLFVATLPIVAHAVARGWWLAAASTLLFDLLMNGFPGDPAGAQRGRARGPSSRPAPPPTSESSHARSVHRLADPGSAVRGARTDCTTRSSSPRRPAVRSRCAMSAGRIGLDEPCSHVGPVCQSIFNKDRW